MVLRIKKQETIRVEKYRLDHRLSVHREDKEIEEYSDNVQASQEFEQRQIFFGFQNYSFFYKLCPIKFTLFTAT